MKELEKNEAAETVDVVVSEEESGRTASSLRDKGVDTTHVIRGVERETGEIRTRLIEGMYGAVPPYGE